MKVFVLAVVGVLVIVGIGYARDTRTSNQRLMIQKYVGTYDFEALIREPRIGPEFKSLLGKDLDRFNRNLDVRGPIDYVDGRLAVSGNAQHRALEETAVLCVDSERFEVHAAVLSSGRISVYARSTLYEPLPLCIKDWISVMNTGAKGRLTKAGNVDMVKVK